MKAITTAAVIMLALLGPSALADETKPVGPVASPDTTTDAIQHDWNGISLATQQQILASQALKESEDFFIKSVNKSLAELTQVKADLKAANDKIAELEKAAKEKSDPPHSEPVKPESHKP